MALKCPHCNGLLALVSTRQVEPDPADAAIQKTVRAWLDQKMPLAEFLSDYDLDDLGPYEPLDRIVVRTAFRSRECIEQLGLGISERHLARIIRGIPGWSDDPAVRLLWGKQSRYWVRLGYEYEPGFAEDGLI